VARRAELVAATPLDAYRGVCWGEIGLDRGLPGAARFQGADAAAQFLSDAELLASLPLMSLRLDGQMPESEEEYDFFHDRVLDARDLAELAGYPALRQLEGLELHDAASPSHVGPILRSSHLDGLRRLVLGEGAFQPVRHERLEELTLRMRWFHGDAADELEDLLDRCELPSLRVLRLDGGTLDIARALDRARLPPRLHTIDLSGSALGIHASAELCATRALERIERLVVWTSGPGRDDLVRRFGDRVTFV
jgi:hypothetical protein